MAILAVPLSIIVAAFAKRFGERMADLAADEVKRSFTFAKDKLIDFIKSKKKASRVEIVSISLKPKILLVFEYNPKLEGEIDKAFQGIDFLDEVLTNLLFPEALDKILEVRFKWEKENWQPVICLSQSKIYTYFDKVWKEYDG